MPNKPLSAEAIEERLDEYLDPVLSTRRSARGPAQILSKLTRAEQSFALRWTSVVAKTNAELAYQFASRVPAALELMDLAATEAWLIQAMDVYDKNGLYPAISILDQVQHYAVELEANAQGVTFDDVAGILQLFVLGLSGRELKLEASDDVYTDTTTLFLPHRVALFTERRDNFRLYKAIAAHLWAQTWYGTFRLNPEPDSREDLSTLVLASVSARFDNPARAVRLFHALETVRLDARIATALTGLRREMAELQNKLERVSYPHRWQSALERLRQPRASVNDSYELLPQFYHGDVPQPLCYQGNLFPERVERAMRERVAREKHAFSMALTRLLAEWQDLQQDNDLVAKLPKAEQLQDRFSVEQTLDPDRADSSAFQLHLDGKPIVPPDDIRTLMASVLQDFDEVPPDYLVAAGDGDYRKDQSKNADDVWRGAHHKEGAFLYKEWDYRRQHYRKNWCVLRELDVHPLEENFVHDTLEKYSGLLTELRRTFEALRGEDKLLKKQKNGDNIDLDAAIEGYADMRHGMELPERLFTKKHKLDRNIAVMLMVDMSGSTKGWINAAERESLVLLCEALEILGDRYAIYGFSGMTRKRCELFRVKNFNEPYSDIVKRRIAGMRPQDYTRMGVIIRHLATLLSDVEARTKVLITLSDGKPDDYDGYRGDYGIEDTRRALIEAKQNGIHPFCITIDTEARDYLPHMYGAVNYTLVDDVNKLPLKIADIYRKLTF